MANSMLCIFLLVLINLFIVLHGAISELLTAVDSDGKNFSTVGSVSPGQSITIKCPLTDGLKWSRSSFIIGSKTEYLKQTDTIKIESNQLKLTNINFKDSGVYYCEQNVASYRFYLHVVAITKTSNGTVPTISTSYEFNGINFNQTKINERESANVSCFCDNGNNSTQISINWKGGRYDKLSNLYRIVTSHPETGVYSTLILKNAANDKDLYGEYTCYCDAVSGTKTESKVYMEVLPVFSAHDTSRRTTEGEDVVLTCNVWAYPAVFNPSIRWSFQNNVVLRPGIIVSGNESQPGYSRLFIPKVTNADRGLYTCHAANSVGTNGASTTLRVKGRYAALWPFIGILVQIIILVVIIVVYEWRKSQKSKNDSSKSTFDSKNEPDAVVAERGNEPDSVRQRLVKA